jgi:hypothetical protein
MGLSLITCSFHALALYSFKHIVMLPGLVILLTIVVFLPIVFFGSLIAWKTKKHIAVSRSSVEVELHVMVVVTAEVT